MFQQQNFILRTLRDLLLYKSLLLTVLKCQLGPFQRHVKELDILMHNTLKACMPSRPYKLVGVHATTDLAGIKSSILSVRTYIRSSRVIKQINLSVHDISTSICCFFFKCRRLSFRYIWPLLRDLSVDA